MVAMQLQTIDTDRLNVRLCGVKPAISDQSQTRRDQ